MSVVYVLLSYIKLRACLNSKCWSLAQSFVSLDECRNTCLIAIMTVCGVPRKKDSVRVSQKWTYTRKGQ